MSDAEPAAAAKRATAQLPAAPSPLARGASERAPHRSATLPMRHAKAADAEDRKAEADGEFLAKVGQYGMALLEELEAERERAEALSARVSELEARLEAAEEAREAQQEQARQARRKLQQESIELSSSLAEATAEANALKRTLARVQDEQRAAAALRSELASAQEELSLAREREGHLLAKARSDAERRVAEVRVECEAEVAAAREETERARKAHAEQREELERQTRTFFANVEDWETRARAATKRAAERAPALVGGPTHARKSSLLDVPVIHARRTSTSQCALFTTQLEALLTLLDGAVDGYTRLSADLAELRALRQVVAVPEVTEAGSLALSHLSADNSAGTAPPSPAQSESGHTAMSAAPQPRPSPQQHSQAEAELREALLAREEALRVALADAAAAREELEALRASQAAERIRTAPAAEAEAKVAQAPEPQPLRLSESLKRLAASRPLQISISPPSSPRLLTVAPDADPQRAASTSVLDAAEDEEAGGEPSLLRAVFRVWRKTHLSSFSSLFQMHAAGGDSRDASPLSQLSDRESGPSS